MGSIRARRRTITFSGSQVTISADIKEGMFGNRQRHTFSLGSIKGVTNAEPRAFGPGRLVFRVEGASTAVLENPAGGGDRVDMNTFCYGGLDTKQVRKLVAEIKKAIGSA